MADAVPVCDVLREAMEYLSKLGSNLRVRSESLKEKRLRKEKLKNVHAVQKAAGKVLLICELSKKSIENVEVGVKNILTQIDASQAAVDCGGKSIEKSDSSKSDIKYEYFQLGSRKLKIRDKVNIKHYTSVKVLAKPMSTLIQEKYPVYYNCNLYRLRKKLKDKGEPESDGVSSHNMNSKNNISINQNSNKDRRDHLTKDHNSSEDKKSSDECDAKKINDSNNETDETQESAYTGKSRTKRKDKSYNKEVKDKSPVGEKRKKFKHIKIIDSSDSDTGTSGRTEVSKPKTNPDLDINEPEKDYNKIQEDEIEGNANLVENDGKMSVTNEINNKSELSMDTRDSQRKPDNVENACTEVQTDVTKDKANDITSQTIVLNDSVIGDDNTEDITTIQHDKMVEEVKSNEKESSSVERETVCTEKINENIDNTPVKEGCQNKVVEDERDKTTAVVSKANLENDTSQSSTDSKPFIKCVNINKLLKEDKIPKANVSLIEIEDSDSDNVVKKSKHKVKSKPNKSKSKFEKIRKRSVCSDNDSNKTDDEEYWKQKRKEVKLFKPKKFAINITQLPKFRSKYLHKNQLRRITQNGTVVCEISMDKQEDSKSEESLKKINEPKDDVNIVKNALLFESDVENDDSSKHALLKDSDSDNNEKDKENSSHSNKKQKRKSSDIEKVKSRKNSSKKSKSRSNTPSPTNDLGDNNLDNNKIKSSLLDSTDESRTPTKKKKSSDSETVRSRKNSSSKSKSRSNTPTKEDNNLDNNKIKSSLLDSTDDSRTPTKKRKTQSDELTPPPSKRKHIMESMHAKKMLLTYSSSSDTEDEQLRNALKEIRDTLLKGDSSDEDNHQKEKESENTSKQCAGEPNMKNNKDLASDNDTSAKDTNSQVDDDTEKRSNTCSEKMGRSKSSAGDSSSQNSDTQESLEKDIDR